MILDAVIKIAHTNCNRHRNREIERERVGYSSMSMNLIVGKSWAGWFGSEPVGQVEQNVVGASCWSPGSTIRPLPCNILQGNKLVLLV